MKQKKVKRKEELCIHFKVNFYRIKKIRNKFNLWIFLTKNPSLIQYRVRVDSAEPNKAEIEEDITILHKNEESNNDIEENKDNIDSESDYEESKRVESSSFEYRINPSDGSYSEKNI